MVSARILSGGRSRHSSPWRWHEMARTDGSVSRKFPVSKGWRANEKAIVRAHTTFVVTWLVAWGFAVIPPVHAEPCPTTGLAVCDANNNLVGTVLSQVQGAILAVRRIGEQPGNPGQPVAIQVTQSGFVELAENGFFVYEQADCSGAPLIQFQVTGYLLPEATALNGKLYYPSGLSTTHLILARQVVAQKKNQCPGSEIPTAPGSSSVLCCVAGRPHKTAAITATSVDVGSLGLTPPFRVVGP
jgi:hypothetical protein